MRIIDCHAHAFPDAVATRAVAALEADVDVRACHDGTLAGLISIMDAAGIEISVIQPVATKPEQVRSANEWAAGITDPRIIAFGAFHPDVENPAAEIRRIAALGLRGIKLHPEYQACAPDDTRLRPALEAASEAGLILLFHAGLDIAIPTLRGTPEAFGRMLDAHPHLRVILAHMGGFELWDRVAAHIVGRDVFLDTSFTLGHLEDEAFVALVRAHGADRVLFGTDSPWADPTDELARLRSSGLSEGELAQILGSNAERMLGIA